MNIKESFPDVIDSYLKTIKEIDAEVEKYFDNKTKELILVAIGVALGNENIVKLHAKNSIKFGATKEELKVIAVMPLPIVGITNSNKAIEIINSLE